MASSPTTGYSGYNPTLFGLPLPSPQSLGIPSSIAADPSNPNLQPLKQPSVLGAVTTMAGNALGFVFGGRVITVIVGLVLIAGGLYAMANTSMIGELKRVSQS